jgi:hypothetical protein
MTTHDLSLDSLPLSLLEQGPVRDIAEIEFDRALDRVEQEMDERLTTEQVHHLHDTVLPAAVIDFLERLGTLRETTDGIFFTPTAQLELCHAFEQGVRQEIMILPQPSQTARCLLNEPFGLTPLLCRTFDRVRKFLFP